MVLYGHKDKNYFLHFQIFSLLFAQKVINKIFYKEHAKSNYIAKTINLQFCIRFELDLDWS